MNFNTIDELTFLDEIHINLIKNPQVPSQVIEADDYSILLLRLLDIGDENLDDASYAYISFQGDFYYVQEGRILQKLIGGFEELLVTINDDLKYMEAILSSLYEEIESLENLLYEREEPRYFMDIWFRLKKHMKRMEKFLYRGKIYVEEFFRIQKKELINDFNNQIEEIRHKFIVENRNSKWSLEKLDSILHFYKSIKDEKLNRNIYLLALVSGVFLPLNLIVGFFGMNTNGLFLKNTENATEVVAIMLLCLFIVLLFGLPLLKILDKYFLRLFLGRYDFYNNLTKKIDQIYNKIDVK